MDGDAAEQHIRARVEAVLFSSSAPLKLEKLAQIVELDKALLRRVLQQLYVEYSQPGRGIVLQEVAGGFQLRTRSEYAEWVVKLKRERSSRLSKAATETLAIVAYRQPVTRAEIEHLRGVDSGGTLRLLLEKQLVRIAGKKDAPGRPLLYATSAYFLEYFGLNDLRDLPGLQELGDPDDVAMSLTIDFEAADE